MTTILKRYKDAYATMTVAVYEPLVVRWYSEIAVHSLADTVVKRAVSKQAAIATRSMRSSLVAIPRRLPEDLSALIAKEPSLAAEIGRSPRGYVDASFTAEAHPELFAMLPALEITENIVYLTGRSNVNRTNPFTDGRTVIERVDTIPILFGPDTQEFRYDLDIPQLRGELTKELQTLLKNPAGGLLPASELRKEILEKADTILGAHGYKPGKDFFQVEGDYIEFLSPIGVAHFYRQFYFNLDAGVGPIEQAFTIAPLESLEIVLETVRRQSHEEVYEMGSETVSESAVESKNLDEVSDKVSSMVERDSNTAMSANATFSASGSIGVWQASGSATLGASSSLAQSSKQSTELASRRLKEITKRASERITKTFSLRVRDTSDFTTTNLTRRVIKNDSSSPASYGLRRVFNRIKVKVQDLGPRLVWQLYIRDPGAGLARSRFVSFMESKSVSNPGDPPSLRSRPVGGTDTGTQSAALKWHTVKKTYYVTLVITLMPDRKITAASIDSVTDLEHLGKDDYAPSPKNDVQWDWEIAQGTPPSNSFARNIGILPGDAKSISLSYTYSYDPSDDVIKAWDDERKTAEDKFAKAELEAKEKALREQFERSRALITEKSKIRSRAASDLRKEERYEVMNRMVSHLFRPTGNQTSPAPLEIELFHRYFDIEAMFIYAHPSWWKPRYTSPSTGLGRKEYEITADSEPAPMGSSLGWLTQLDGDARRNEFLNSPWVRACVPMRPNREREAIAWLAAHIEGEIGYAPSKDPLKSLLADIEKIRTDQDALGINGPDYVTVDSSVGAPAAALHPWERLFPIVDEFEVTLPTDGFVYDGLDVQIP